MDPEEMEKLKSILMTLRCRAHNFKVSISANNEFKFTCCCKDLEEEVLFVIETARRSKVIDKTHLMEALEKRRKLQLENAAQQVKKVLSAPQPEVYINGKWWKI